MPNRSREEIVAHMLEALLSPVNKTTVMFRARLSYAQLTYYLQMLHDAGLIMKKEDLWVVTERGREYIIAYSMIKEIVESVPTIQMLR